MIIRHLLLAASLVLTCTVPAQSAPLTEHHLLRSLRLHADRQCAKVVNLSKDAKAGAEATALLAVRDMACDCMPAEIDAALAKADASAEERELTNAEAIKTASTLQARCTAKHLRRLVKQQCAQDLPDTASREARQAHCACVSDIADRTPDQRWVDDSITKHEHFMATVRARMAGEPEPPAPSTVLTTIAADCKAKAHPTLTAPTAALRDWLGTWHGPEGTYLTLIEKKSGQYDVIIKDLDTERTFTGTAGADHIRFERDGQSEQIRQTHGRDTGMKWLADRSTCLTVKTGEGFCRD